MSKKIDIKTNYWLIKDALISKNEVQPRSRKKYLFLKVILVLERINSLFSNLSSLSLWELNKLAERL